MKRCAAPWPDHDTTCTLPPGEHWDHEDDDGGHWPNEPVRVACGRLAPGTGGLDRAAEIARAATPPASVRMIPPLPSRREPTDPTARAVLDHLLTRAGQWFTGAELSDPTVGGPTGAHQPGGLRRDGWPVKSRIRQGTTDVWEHRIPRSAALSLSEGAAPKG